eukprot:scaffold17091_cov77-Skeletonema_dohrnii-CCMP3373.AAC.5
MQSSTRAAMEELDCLLVKEQSAQYQISALLWNLNGKKKCSSPLRWRHAICDWYYDFVDHFKFDREVVGVAVNYFDRYTSINAVSLDDNENALSTYHIVAVTALFLAIKLHATSCEVDDLQELRNRALSKILYDTPQPKNMLEDMEMNMLQALEWSVNPPTLHQFAFLFNKFHSSREICTGSESYIYEATRYQVELVIFVPQLLAKFKPSIIAFAAMKNAEEKIAAHNPVPTTDMKLSYEALTSHSGVVVDSTAVAQCQMLLKRVCPELPDLEHFHEAATHSTIIDMQVDRNLANSPAIVTDF